MNYLPMLTNMRLMQFYKCRKMKRCLILFIIFIISTTAHTQVVIPFGGSTSTSEPKEKQWKELIKKSYVLNFRHSVSDSVEDTILIDDVISLHSNSCNYCILYKDDSTRIAVEITKLKSQKGYTITVYRIKGSIKRISGYDVNLLRSGKWVEYNTNRSIKVMGKYKNGKKIKRWQYYDLDGNKTLTENYVNGVVTDKHPR